MDILTKKEATLRGLSKYYTGVKCKNGHAALRYTTTGMCTACRTMHSRNASQRLQQAKRERAKGKQPYTLMIYPELITAIVRHIDGLNAAFELEE